MLQQTPSGDRSEQQNVRGMPLGNPALDYWLDAWQRGILFLDVLRERGNQHLAQIESEAPNVLTFEYEVVMTGQSLERSVNNGLARIVPPPGTSVDPRKRPFIVFDPRAGHGPGIGGMKPDSEIGVALKAGHPCYGVGFLTAPVPGQTVEDVCRAQARFIEFVAERHKDAEGKPCLIGNCQAGWQIMMTAAMRPALPGPIVLVGSPLSYWSGVRGQRSLRYLGGLLGGTWLTSLAGDLGKGIFDGANLVANFEFENPSNTFWKKPYNLYSQVDTEAARFLAFERWWGSPVLLTSDEMQYMTDQLFVGNKLATGQLRASDGLRIDLRNIKGPIIVFCSYGDDITPPQQALDWILDLYENERQISEAGQTIVYCLHQSIGHLGIFVSGKVATKEHEELAFAMDMIDAMPPGLYEAVITEVRSDTARTDLVHGRYLFTLETRTLDDVRALGGNDATDEMRFETVARLSEINQGLYATVARPVVQQMASEQSAEWLRRLHPHRVRFEIFSDRNPCMGGLSQLAEAVRQQRLPVAADNPFLAAEHQLSQWIIDGWDRAAELRDRWQEAFFMSTFGSPLLQAMLGLRGEHAVTTRHAERELIREADVQGAIAVAEAGLARGGAVAAAVRAMLFVLRPARRVDERAFAMMRMIAAEAPLEHRLGAVAFKEVLREQALTLLTDEARAIEALPRMVPNRGRVRELVLDAVRRVVTVSGTLPPASQSRLAEVEALLAAKPKQQLAEHKSHQIGGA